MLTWFRSIGPSTGQSSRISYFGGGRRFGLPTAFFFVFPPDDLLGARSPFFGEEIVSAWRGDSMITIPPATHRLHHQPRTASATSSTDHSSPRHATPALATGATPGAVDLAQYGTMASPDGLPYNPVFICGGWLCISL
eukprot:COSAG02_NODE_3528_length_6612_cov_9.525411_3_plen_138_part_00